MGTQGGGIGGGGLAGVGRGEASVGRGAGCGEASRGPRVKGAEQVQRGPEEFSHITIN